MKSILIALAVGILIGKLLPVWLLVVLALVAIAAAFYLGRYRRPAAPGRI